jgi:hypothetical protein
MLSFSPPLVNGPGPDLVVFEIGDPQTNPIQLTVNGTSGTVSGSEWGRTEYFPNVDVYAKVGGIPTNISQLESGTFEKIQSWNTFPLIALAIDLGELGVSPLAEIRTVQFGTSPGRFYFEPVLFMGIRSAAALAIDFKGEGTAHTGVPEPAGAALFLFAFGALVLSNPSPQTRL